MRARARVFGALAAAAVVALAVFAAGGPGASAAPNPAQQHWGGSGSCTTSSTGYCSVAWPAAAGIPVGTVPQAVTVTPATTAIVSVDQVTATGYRVRFAKSISGSGSVTAWASTAFTWSVSVDWVEAPPVTPTPSATTTTATATPTPTTPSPSATTPSPTPTSTATAYACTTAGTNGRCGPYATHPTITGANSDPWVDQNVWSQDPGYKQTLYANGPTDWYVVANANNASGSVLTYPNTGFWMDGAVDSKTTTTSSYAVTFPHNAQTQGWAGYDLWFNSWADEVMIQTDFSVNANYDCTPVATATFSGQPWHLCVFGSERVWKPGTDDQHLASAASGTIDVRAFLVWMEQNRYLPAGSTWTAASFGFEVCNTSGVDTTFKVDAFSWSST